MDEDRVQVNIFYEKFDYTLVKQVAKITPGNLFGNIGGIFGLLIGGSIISIAEIIELIYFIIYNNFFKCYFRLIHEKIRDLPVKN